MKSNEGTIIPLRIRRRYRCLQGNRDGRRRICLKKLRNGILELLGMNGLETQCIFGGGRNRERIPRAPYIKYLKEAKLTRVTNPSYLFKRKAMEEL